MQMSTVLDICFWILIWSVIFHYFCDYTQNLFLIVLSLVFITVMCTYTKFAVKTCVVAVYLEEEEEESAMI